MEEEVCSFTPISSVSPMIGYLISMIRSIDLRVHICLG